MSRYFLPNSGGLLTLRTMEKAYIVGKRVKINTQHHCFYAANAKKFAMESLSLIANLSESHIARERGGIQVCCERVGDNN